MNPKQIDVCEKLFSIAFDQYTTGKIDKEEYRTTLLMIRKKNREIKLRFFDMDFINKSFNKPILEINIAETINYILAVN